MYTNIHKTRLSSKNHALFADIGDDFMANTGKVLSVLDKKD
jgi:hypothetical protein